jgi:hypothetical protein
VFQCKAYKKQFSNGFNCKWEEVTISHVPVPEALHYTRLDLKEGLNNLGFVSRSGFETHTVVEDETWIFVREVLVADVRFSEANMSDINGGLQSFQQWIKCS